MTVTFKVYKKSSANGKVTLYLGRRDFVDHVTGSDPVDGVVNIDKEFLNDKTVTVQLVCAFRYGREVMNVVSGSMIVNILLIRTMRRLV